MCQLDNSVFFVYTVFMHLAPGILKPPLFLNMVRVILHNPLLISRDHSYGKPDWVHLPPKRHHQFDFDSVGNHDAHHLLVGPFFYSAAHTGHMQTGMRETQCERSSGYISMSLCNCLSDAYLYMCVYMVLEARLVSSCFSFPSRARPLFSLFIPSTGVRE